MPSINTVRYKVTSCERNFEEIGTNVPIENFLDF